jgi:hypothetical protein
MTRGMAPSTSLRVTHHASVGGSSLYSTGVTIRASSVGDTNPPMITHASGAGPPRRSASRDRTPARRRPPRAADLQELRQPRRVSRPRRSRDQAPIRDRLIKRNIDPASAGLDHLRRAGGIVGDFLPPYHAGGGQTLSFGDAPASGGALGSTARRTKGPTYAFTVGRRVVLVRDDTTYLRHEMLHHILPVAGWRPHALRPGERHTIADLHPMPLFGMCTGGR